MIKIPSVKFNPETVKLVGTGDAVPYVVFTAASAPLRLTAGAEDEPEVATITLSIKARFAVVSILTVELACPPVKFRVLVSYEADDIVAV